MQIAIGAIFKLPDLHDSFSDAKSMPSVGAIHSYRIPNCVFRLLVTNAGKMFPAPASN